MSLIRHVRFPKASIVLSARVNSLSQETGSPKVQGSFRLRPSSDGTPLRNDLELG
jgi:hypothetical protein